jgi:hypothetical protein
MESLRYDLSPDDANEDCKQDQRAQRITEIQRHREGVAAGFSQGRCGNLDDPERQRDFRNLVEGCARILRDADYQGGFFHSGSMRFATERGV